MCGRYAMSLQVSELQRRIQQDKIPIGAVRKSDAYRPTYNVPPTRTAPVYYFDGDGEDSRDKTATKPTLQFMTWGLIPGWVKSRAELKKTHYSTFNARVESVISGNRLWKSVRDKRRCVVPIEGYYEWEDRSDPKTGKSVKVPYFISRKDGDLIYLAGFWSRSVFQKEGESEDGGEKEEVYSFTVITGPADKELRWLHERIPITLQPGTKEWNLWLSDEKWDGNVSNATKFYKEGVFQWYEVSRDVGKTSSEGEYLVKPVVEKEGALDGFFKKKGISKEIKEEDKKSKLYSIENSKEGDDDKVKKVDSKKESDTRVKKESPQASPKTSPPKSKRSNDSKQPSILDHMNKKTKTEPKKEEGSTISERIHKEHHGS